MAQQDYESLTAFWTTFEEHNWAAAAAANDEVDETTMAHGKMMFFLGASLTLRILNKAGVIDEDTMPAVAAMATEIRSIQIEVPNEESE
jgi:hypothetical protein